MALRPPAHLGPRIPGDTSRPSTETLLQSLLASGVFRRNVCVPLYDQQFGQCLYEDLDEDTPQAFALETYVSVTGTSITISPPADATYLCYVVGGVTFTDASNSDASVVIYDGAATHHEQRASVPAGDYIPATCEYVAEIDASTTFNLQVKLNGPGITVATHTAHISVIAIPQATRYNTEPTVHTIPLYVCEGASEMVQRFKLVCAGALTKNQASYYRMRFGVKREGRLDVLTTFDGQTRSLSEGVPFDLTTQDIQRRLRTGDVVVIEVLRTGSPTTLVGTTCQLTLQYVGEDN